MASEFGGTVGAAGHAGLRAGAGGCAAAPAVYVGRGVFHVHIAVGEVEAVLLIDVVFTAEGEPEAVGIGQGAHAGVGAACDRQAVRAFERRMAAFLQAAG